MGPWLLARKAVSVAPAKRYSDIHARKMIMDPDEDDDDDDGDEGFCHILGLCFLKRRLVAILRSMAPRPNTKGFIHHSLHLLYVVSPCPPFPCPQRAFGPVLTLKVLRHIHPYPENVLRVQVGQNLDRSCSHICIQMVRASELPSVLNYGFFYWGHLRNFWGNFVLAQNPKGLRSSQRVIIALGGPWLVPPKKFAY